MSDDTSKRKRFVMSGDARALRGFRDRDTARLEALMPMDVPEEIDPDREPTAPPTVLPIPDDEESGDPDLRDVVRRMNAIIEAIGILTKATWPSRKDQNHLVELNTRIRQLEEARAGGDCGELIDRVDEVKKRLDIAIGVQGDNGKLGKLTSRVGLMWAGLGVVLMTALGSVGVALRASNAAGERDGRNEARLDQLRHDVDRIADQVQQLWTFQFRAPVAHVPGATP